MDDENGLTNRRDFLKMAAAGAVGSMALSGCSSSQAEAVSTRTVTIIGVLDIAQALADNSLVDNLYWFDSNARKGSLYQGTDHLRTVISPGDLVLWVVSGLQVETLADIARITGPAASIANAASSPIAPGVNFWSGKIGLDASGVYEYDIALQVEGRLMTASKPLVLDVRY